MKAIKNIGLGILLDQKPNPPRERWMPLECKYEFCFRRAYPMHKRRCKEWLRTKGFSNAWLCVRPQVRACCGDQFASSFFDPQQLFCVPEMFLCAMCRVLDYCGRACQKLDLYTHKPACQLLQERNAFVLGVRPPNQEQQQQD